MLCADEKLDEFVVKHFTMSHLIISLSLFLGGGGYSIENCATDGDGELFTKIHLFFIESWLNC